MSSSLLLCPVCQGDARASRDCVRCGGAGVSLTTDAGAVVWRARLDEEAFFLRRLRRRTNRIFHALLFLVIALTFVATALLTISRAAGAYRLSAVFLPFISWSPQGPQQGGVLLFWCAVSLSCFLIFRLRAYQDQAKTLPGWGGSALAVSDRYRRLDHVIDVSAYASPELWQVLEQAHGLAVRLGQGEVRPIHVVSAMLGTETGGMYMTRLGMDFEKIKPGMVELLRRGEAGQPTTFSADVKRLLVLSYAAASDAHRKHVGATEFFLQAFDTDTSLQKLWDTAGYPAEHVRHVAEWIRFQKGMQEERERFYFLASLKPDRAMNRTMTAQSTPVLDSVSEDLTRLARNGYIGPTVGRDGQMAELLRAIEGGQRSVVIVGEAGTGKTALVEALARRMVEEDVPPTLFDRRLVSLHVPPLLASGDPGAAADRFLQVLQEASASGNVILVIHGIEMLVGGSGQGPLDVAEALAAEMDRGRFVVIATTTPRAWVAYLERRSIGAKLTRVDLPEMESGDAIRVLMLRSGGIEYQNKIFFSYAALERSVALASRYLRDNRLPESALRLIQEAAVSVRAAKGEYAFVGPEDIARMVQEKTHIPVEAVTRGESEKLLQLEDHLHRRIIGQDEAVMAVAQAMRRARADIREGKRPIANFLFLGPTGVGKTELAKALAAEYFGSEQMIVRMDMSEYQDASSVARVIGVPGDERGGLLTEAVRRQPFTLLLLDEIEKAHPDILTLFLQVMDDGRLTDGVGRTVDFTNVVLIATSNAATSFIQEQVAAGTPFAQIKNALLERELKSVFRPEFLNRFDGVIVCRPLTQEEVARIARLMLDGLARRLEEKGITFRVDDAALTALAREGFDPQFGARPLRRTVQEKVENPLADLLLRHAIERGDTVMLGPDGTLAVEKGHA